MAPGQSSDLNSGAHTRLYFISNDPDKGMLSNAQYNRLRLQLQVLPLSQGQVEKAQYHSGGSTTNAYITVDNPLLDLNPDHQSSSFSLTSFATSMRHLSIMASRDPPDSQSIHYRYFADTLSENSNVRPYAGMYIAAAIPYDGEIRMPHKIQLKIAEYAARSDIYAADVY
ncbi:hypothetical protein SODALDRAFT_382405 [Sodiomyces alkalinus F11]|uniref:Uncharacterized protein n=1 Tax=Sodiomyces alkalinus (strain CBS 110278 / VKM F-3762 / F11) TaxID=1314773 RepID=A0A3N2PJ92_SODAK|nr:hypothetical protein SODALDRAFT_382405 [Sodiomyces alkalinus F11]ROT34607.1 hypothetical protein SODALDRAFT_382405 [Sodiomyces alkalinus F11]